MEFHFTSKLEEYYQKFVELQDKLKKSEEQRFLLEMKFNEMVQVAKEEEQVHYKKLRAQYKRFLEEDKKRQDRNERIIRNLERIETRISMLSAKTERINMLRRQYQNFLLRIASKPKQDPGISRERSFVRQEQKRPLFSDDTSLPQKPTESLDLKKPLLQHPTVKKALEKDQSNEEKIEILDRYLQSISSQRCRDLLNQERESREKLMLGTRPDVLWKDDAPSTNHATAIADDIMNSIYSRYYNKTDGLLNNRKLNLEKVTAKAKPDPPQSELVKDDDLTNIAAANKAKQVKINENEVTLYDNDYNDTAEEEERTDENEAISVEAAENKEPMQNSHKDDHISEASNGNFSGNDDNLDSQEDLLLAQQLQEKIPVRLEDYAEYNPPKAYPREPIRTQDIVSDQADYVDQYENLQYDQNEQPIINNEQFLQYEENAQNLPYQYNEQQGYQADEHEANQLQVQDNQYYENELAGQYYPEGSVQDDLPVQQYQENVAVTEGTALPYETDQDLIQEHYDQPVLYDQQQPIQYDQQQPIRYNQQKPIQYDQQQSIQYDSRKSNQYDQQQPIQYDQQQSIQYDQQKPIQYDPQKQILHDQQKPIQYDQQQSIQYDQQKPIPYDPQKQIVHDQQKPIQYDQQQPIQYDQQQPIQYDQQQPIQYDPQKQILHDQQQPIQYDPQKQILYDQAQPIQYDPQKPIQYDQQGKDVGYDPDAQLTGYDQYGQPLLYDQHGQIAQLQYDENGQIIPQYDKNGQLILLYDQNGQQYFGDQQQYDEQGQPVAQYDEQGQPIAHYEEQSQPVAQYDEQGQPVAQYDDQGQPVAQYDVNGQPIYSEDYNYTNPNEESDLGYYVEPEREQLSEKEANAYQEHAAEEEVRVEPTKQNDNEEIKVMDMLDTDTESTKQNTSKVSNDADFDFS